jgi:hypothetical protein
MLGLDPGIHPLRKSLAKVMDAGSSPAMTVRESGKRLYPNIQEKIKWLPRT